MNFDVFAIVCFVIVVFLAIIFAIKNAPITSKESNMYIAEKRKNTDVELPKAWKHLEACNSFFEE